MEKIIANEHGVCVERPDGVLQVIIQPQDGKAYILVPERRPKGKWVWASTFPKRVLCSNCGSSYQNCAGYIFCPCCGADMRGEE